MRAKAPSLLWSLRITGLLKDEHGRRFVPNHATKKTKRYRYYVTSRDEKVELDKPVMRIPAHDLEAAVIERLREFLTDQSELARHFDPEGLKQTIKAGEAFASALHANSPQSVRDALQSIVKMIIVGEHGIEIALQRETDLGEAASDIALDLKAVRVRTGGETKLVIASRGTDAVHVDEKLAVLLVEA